MDRSNNPILNLLYRGTVSIQDFNWDQMITTPILSLMTMEDISYIRGLITSPRYSGNNKLKMEKIDEVMHMRGFTRFAGGTNRLVYTHPMATNAVFKVAIDSVGINDNPAEFKNQQFLKPYCTKVFECSPCGTIASFEKIDRITTFEEFYSIADDYFYLVSRVILGKYVMEDIGTNFYMNIGIRKGFGIVLLDFPYLFELDGGKLLCQNILDDKSICGGEIDYDAGFNKLICTKCGRIYKARDLAKPPTAGGILLRKKGAQKMKVLITRGDDIVKTVDSTEERDHLSYAEGRKKMRLSRRVPEVIIVRTEKKASSLKETVTKSSESVETKKAVSTVSETAKTNTVKNIITVSMGKKDAIAADPQVEKTTDLNVKIIKREVKNHVKKTNPTVVRTSTNNNSASVVKPKHKSSEAPVLKRIINVTINKNNGTSAVIPTTERSNSDIKVTIEKTPIKSTEAKIIPISKPENMIKKNLSEKKETKVEHRIINVKIGSIPTDVESILPNIVKTEPKVESKKEDEVKTPIEEKVEETKVEEVVEEIFTKSEAEESKESEVTNVEPEAVDETLIDEPVAIETETTEEVKSEVPVMIPAITFGDEEPTEPVVDETMVESEEENVEAVVDESIIEEADEESVEEIVDHTEDYEDPEAFNTETQSVMDALLFVKNIPEDPDPSIFYCIPKDRDLDLTDYSGKFSPLLIHDIDPEKFDLFMLTEGEVRKVIYDAESDFVVLDDDEDEEETDVLPAVIESESSDESAEEETMNEEEYLVQAAAALTAQDRPSLSDLMNAVEE